MPDTEKQPRERKHVPGLVLPFLARELMYQLESSEWMVWTILFLHSNREGYCFLSNDRVVLETGLALSTVQRAKSGTGPGKGLIDKGWLVNCGQRNFGSNEYQVAIPLPEPIKDFIFKLWDILNDETWWEAVGDDRHNYAEEHLDWLIAWRVVRALRTAQAKFECEWMPHEPIPSEMRDEANSDLVAILRTAGAKATGDRGLWWIFGDGFDLAKNGAL